MAFEGSYAAQWLVATLTGSAPLMAIVTGVYHDLAPQGAPTPYVIWWQHGEGNDDNAAGRRAFSNVLRGVKVVSTEGTQDDESIAATDIIDGLLAGQSVEIDTSLIRLNIMSAGEIDCPENAAGARIYRHRGRLWRMTTSG